MVRPKDQTKEVAIREKALEMIVEKGFDGLSMQKLAKAANVSPATIYLYFENREDLLNQIYLDIDEKFTESGLKDFNPEMSLEEGLWVQWRNRFHHNQNYPLHFRFIEQFIHSPLVKHIKEKNGPFKQAMGKFFHNCIERGELKDIEPEIFWAIAYGPLYGLMRFQRSGVGMKGKKFTLTEQKLKETFKMALSALKA